MRKIFKHFILVFLLFKCLDVVAVSYTTCEPGELERLDSNYLPPKVGNVYARSGMASRLKYDITHMTIKDNRLYLVGWAFKPNIPQTLGSNATVEFQLVPEGEQPGSANSIKFDIKYAGAGNGHNSFTDIGNPKYYDLTYWNCWHGGYTCHEENTVRLLGGFSASVDLNSIKPKNGKKTTYSVKMKHSLNSGWVDIAVANKHVDNEVKSQKVFDLENNKITFNSNFEKSVRTDVGQGRVMGESGFYCDSIFAWLKKDGRFSGGNWKPNETYYRNDHILTINDSAFVTSCRGGTTGYNGGAATCSSNRKSGPGAIEMYPVNVSSKGGSFDDYGTGASTYGVENKVAYIPALWVDFTGRMTLSIEPSDPPKEEEPGDPFTTDPNRCVGKDVYSVYYLLQHEIIRSSVRMTKAETESLNLIADQKILETVTGDPNKGFEWIETQGEGIVTVVNKATKESEMSLEEFWKRRNRGPYDENLMYGEDKKDGKGKNYYVKHAYYKNDYGIWRHSQTGCEVKISKGTAAVPQEFEFVDKNCPKSNKSESGSNDSKSTNVNMEGFDAFKKVAVSLKNAVIDTQEGNKQHTKNNGLVIKRYYDADKKYLIADPSVNAVADTGPRLQQPLVYRWDICLKDDGEPEPEKPDCSDAVNSASCVEGEEGTGGYFNESDDLKTCTLSKNVDSGFLIVENDYCTVGCKDDISALLPSYKYAKAGQFFILDNNIPTVTGKRTCVTNKIDYDKYDQDLKTLGDKMISEYNTSKDYEERANDFAPDKVQIEEHKETKTLNTCCGGNCLGDSEAYAIYVKNNSDYQSLSDLKGKVIATFIHDVSLSQYINGDIKGQYDLDFYVNKKGIIIDNDVNEIQKLFDNDEIDAVLIKIGAASGLRDVRVIDGSGSKVETIEYTYKKWKVPARTKRRPNSNVNTSDFAEKTGDYGGVSDVSCQNGTVVETELGKDSFEDEKKKMEAAAKSARNNYLNALREYKDVITNFNKCFSWTDKAPTVRNIGEDNYSIESAKSGENFEYQFNPKVTFSYEDEDSYVFGNMPFDYKSQKLNILSTDDPEPKRYYWDRTTDIDEKYSKDTNEEKSGYNDIGFSLSKRNYLNCYGKDTCTVDSTIEGDFYNNTAYIKREEEITYTYHLPQIYTLIPSGKLSGSDLKPNIPLPKEAVPVNINTNAGLYDYYISVKEISDKIRKEKSLTKETDQFEKRYDESGALGNYEGVNEVEEGYMCHYKVENEIYTPPGDPNKLGEINFFYRPVDTYDISHPNNYPLGPNWSDARGQEVQQRIKKDAEDYQELIKEENKGRFTFRLTPTVMKQIRYYNGEQSIKEENSFADFNLSCYDKGDAKGYHCYSPFLSCLASSGQNKEGSEQTKVASCETIFKNTLNNHETKYGYSDLKRNREYLIEKQEKLDRQEEVAE